MKFKINLLPFIVATSLVLVGVWELYWIYYVLLGLVIVGNTILYSTLYYGKKTKKKEFPEIIEKFKEAKYHMVFNNILYASIVAYFGAYALTIAYVVNMLIYLWISREDKV